MPTVQPPLTSSNFHITYHAQLIQELRDRYAVILNVAAQISIAIESNQLYRIPKLMGTFHSKLNQYLFLEGTKLYTYLQRSLVNEPIKFKEVRQIRRDVDKVSLILMDYLERNKEISYSAFVANSEDGKGIKERLISDFSKISSFLNRRLQLQETYTYPKYKPTL